MPPSALWQLLVCALAATAACTLSLKSWALEVTTLGGALPPAVAEGLDVSIPDDGYDGTSMVCSTIVVP